MTFIIGMFISFLKPWHLTLYQDNEVIRLIGVGMLLISLILNTLAYRMFKKHLTPHAPFSIPKVLIQKGVFSLSRNPVYLALVLSQCGLGFVFDNVWLLLSALILLIFLEYLIVPDEEKILERRFKKSYEHYKKDTRRWL